MKDHLAKVTKSMVTYHRFISRILRQFDFVQYEILREYVMGSDVAVLLCHVTELFTWSLPLTIV